MRVADGVSQTQTELNLASWTELPALINGTFTQYVRPGATTFTAEPTWAGTPTTGSDLVNKVYLYSMLIVVGGGVATISSGGLPIVVCGTAFASTGSINPASGTPGGYLSSADWLTFNNKLNRTGDTITGELSLPASGLSVGVNHLEYIGGATFLATDAGAGPNNSVMWTAVNYFGGGYRYLDGSPCGIGWDEVAAG